jgi:hypothetical protein
MPTKSVSLTAGILSGGSTSASTRALYREEIVFCAKEATSGTIQDPTAADSVLPISAGEANMPIELLEDEQFRNTRSKLPLIRGRTPPGSWKLDTYIKPSGTLGTAPEGSTLYECAFGTKTTVASTSVKYTLADDLPSFTLWRKLGHTMFVNRGCTVDKAEFTVQGDQIGKAAWSGNFIEQATIGTTVVDTGGIDGSATTLPVDHGDRFFVTSSTYGYIIVDEEVMKVTAVSGNNLTVVRGALGTTAAAHVADAAVVPYLPAVSEAGEIIHGKLGAVTFDGTNTFLVNSKIAINNNIKYYDNEKNGVLTAESYGTPGHRTLTLTTSKYYRKEDTVDFSKAYNRTLQNIILNLGSTSGSIARFNAPYGQILAPKFSGSTEVMEDVEIRLIAQVGDYNSELSVTFL